MQKIVDAGFSEEQAENALKYTKNNVDRALRMLQKRDDSENNRQREKPSKESEPPKRKGRNKDNDDDITSVKPSGKVSLFDFLEDKLPNVPDKDKSTNRSTGTSYNTEETNDKSYNNDRQSAKNNSRGPGSRYNNTNKPRHDNNHNSRGYSHDNHHNRDDRKYMQSEKPPRFQKKLEEKNRQQQSQLNNVNPSYNNYYNHSPNQYNRTDRNHIDNKVQSYRNNGMDSLVDATANLNLMSNMQPRPNEEQPCNYPPEQTYMKPHYPNQSIQEMPTYRRNNEVPKYPETYRRPQPNGYIEPSQNPVYPNINYMGQGQGGYAGRQYGYGGRPQEFNPMRAGGPFLPGSLLGFQNAAVNEQARAMLGTADIPWKIGDRCLALYWEDNNVSFFHKYIICNCNINVNI